MAQAITNNASNDASCAGPTTLHTLVTDLTVRFPEFKQNKFFITGMSLTPMAKKYAH